MNAPRYRIGIDKEKAVNWSGWYSDFSTESQAAEALAGAIQKDLRKFHIYEVKPNSEIPLEKRKEIIRAAVAQLADSIFLELVPLCDRAGLPLIDVRDDIRRHFKESPARERIIENLERIQEAVQEIARDYSKVCQGQSKAASKYGCETKFFKLSFPACFFMRV
jgi:hypothetical protein